ncbi:MAG: ABC transporter ATP-binding protein [Betaproteobacteria bacterium]|nr:ABC transporter ATP-binding protein [Betaproteobacteria bacterium]
MDVHRGRGNDRRRIRGAWQADPQVRRNASHGRNCGRDDHHRPVRPADERGAAGHRETPVPLALGGAPVKNKIQVAVTQRFNGLTVFDRLQFSVRENEFLCVLGKSGCGKTTLANLMTGLVPATQGGVTIDGEPVNPKRHELAFVFQEPSLWPWRNVRDNVNIGLEIKQVPRDEAGRRLDEMIELVGLQGFENYYPYQISGGMKQRVAIARAFAVDADLILMDEPFAALDAQTRQAMQAEVLRIWERLKHTVVFITHSLEEAIYLAERIIVLSDKPATIKGDFVVEVPRPRDFAHPGFIELRKRLGELIGVW